MLNKELIEVHAHLWYEDVSIYLLDKLREAWDGRVNLSLIKDAESNQAIVSHSEKLFPEVRYIEVKNLGNDQSGFKQSFTKNTEDKPWVFYVHDKNKIKQNWIDDIVDPIVCQPNRVNSLIEKEEIGLISSGNPTRRMDILNEEKLIDYDRRTPIPEKKRIVLSRQTLVWLRELQYILYEKHGFIAKENLNFSFTSGTMFVIRSDVTAMAHSCIHDNYFPDFYREDGDMPHALERFYYYVSICLDYRNEFI